MLIERRVKAATENGWPEFAGVFDPLCIPWREKREDAHPELQTLLKFFASCTGLRSWSRIQHESLYDSKDFLSEREIQIPRVGKPLGQLRTWVPEGLGQGRLRTGETEFPWLRRANQASKGAPLKTLR